MACNSAVVCPTKEYLLPSCSSRDSASDEIVLLRNHQIWPPERAKRQTISRRAVTLFCKDDIAGVIHPKVKLYI